MVEALYIAATYDKEQAVADYLADALAKNQLTLSRLQQQFIPNATAALPPIETHQHALDSYDQLLSHSNDTHRDAPPTPNSNDTTTHQQ